jgi:hypothetical protein
MLRIQYKGNYASVFFKPASFCKIFLNIKGKNAFDAGEYFTL